MAFLLLDLGDLLIRCEWGRKIWAEGLREFRRTRLEGPRQPRLQTNRRLSACTLGDMEGSQAEQVKGRTAIARFRFSKP
jgi:hypothetical protein